MRKVTGDNNDDEKRQLRPLRTFALPVLFVSKMLTLSDFLELDRMTAITIATPLTTDRLIASIFLFLCDIACKH